MKKLGPDLLFVLVITAALGAMLVVGLMWGFEDKDVPRSAPPLPEISSPPQDMAKHLAQGVNRIRDANSSETNQKIAVLLDPKGIDPEALAPGGRRYEEILSLGESVVPALVVRLVKGRPNERETAARLLGEIGSPEAVGYLASGLEDEAYEVQACCASALGRIGDRSAAADLIRWEIVKTPREGIVKVRVAEALCALGCTRGVRGLIHALTGEVFFIRIALAALRRYTGQQFSMNPYALRSEREKKAAEWVSWWFENQRGFRLRNTAVDRTDPVRLAWCVARELEQTRGNRYYYMLQAKKVLSGLGALAMPYLLHALYAGNPEEAYHESYEVRLAAAHVFELYGRAGVDVRGAPRHLESVLARDANHSVRAQSAASLGWCGDRRCVPFLLASLTEDRDLSVRLEAAMSLGRLGFSDGLSPLRALLKKGGQPQELALEMETACERIQGGSGLLTLVAALEKGLSGSPSGEKAPPNRLADRAHQRLVEETGRIPKGAETLASLSWEKRRSVLEGWRRTVAERELFRGLGDALASGSGNRAKEACQGLKKAYLLDEKILPEDPAQAYPLWAALVDIWLRLETMARALDDNDLLTYQAHRAKLAALFGLKTPEHPGLHPLERKAALHTITAWAEKVDPF